MSNIEEEKFMFDRNFSMLNKSLNIYLEIINKIRTDEELKSSHYIHDSKIVDNCLQFYFLGAQIKSYFVIENFNNNGMVKPLVKFSIVKEEREIEIVTFEIYDSYLTNKEKDSYVPFDNDRESLLLYLVLNLFHKNVRPGLGAVGNGIGPR